MASVQGWAPPISTSHQLAEGGERRCAARRLAIQRGGRAAWRGVTFASELRPSTSSVVAFSVPGESWGSSGGGGGGDGGVWDDDAFASPTARRLRREAEGRSNQQPSAQQRPRARPTVNARLLEEIEAIERARPPRPQDAPAKEDAPWGGRPEDLQGINPLLTLASGAFAWAASSSMWAVTGWLAHEFSVHPVPADAFYVVQRIAAVARTTAVGASALGSGVFAMCGAGLLLLSARVAVGVASGEIDMSAPQTPARRTGAGSIEERVEKVKRFMRGDFYSRSDFKQPS